MQQPARGAEYDPQHGQVVLAGEGQHLIQAAPLRRSPGPAPDPAELDVDPDVARAHRLGLGEEALLLCEGHAAGVERGVRADGSGLRGRGADGQDEAARRTAASRIGASIRAGRTLSTLLYIGLD